MSSWIPSIVSSSVSSLFASVSVPSAGPLAPSSIDEALTLDDGVASDDEKAEETLFRKSQDPPIAVEPAAELEEEPASIASSVSVAPPPPSISVAPPAAMPPPPPPIISLSPSTSQQEEEDDDTPPQFPLPDSFQRSSAPSTLPPPPPSFSVSVTPPAALRSIHDEVDSSSGLAPAATNKKSLETPTTTTKVVKARGKVALAPGHSPLDWARVKSSGQYDGRSLKGDIDHFPIRVTPSLLKQHNGRNGTDAWSAYNGKVYNIGPYMKFHPGGEKELLRTAGRDGTKLFMATHAWVNPDMMMDTCLVGFLVPE